MPGSYYSDLDSSGSPSEEEQDMFRLAHDTSPSWRSTNPTSPLRSPSPSRGARVPPFHPIPSAQPRPSFPSSSPPPPFTNMSYSTQAASSILPSPPSSQHERPWSPLSAADSLPTLRQGAPRQLFSPPMSPTPRPQNRGRGSSHAHGPDGVDAQALNAVVDGIGSMQVSMNLDQAGRWRIARRTGAPW
ncbi:hypothetical protein Trco_001623 [Trichoderma cornu-damae]|uniref:Uncharacterized protein n=1 Tax=Trichoderma cornu-damae TaxID=654480 RepID=A0A9P8U0D7_9HYPO|nr:hypothetical protein Trco_001623 [Trichoderma cornu-damae]